MITDLALSLLPDGHFQRMLKRKYRRATDEKEKNAIANALADDASRDDLRVQLIEAAGVEGSGITALPSGGILAQLILWFEQNWQAILAAILKLFGG